MTSNTQEKDATKSTRWWVLKSNKECSTKFTKNELIVTLINVPTFLWTQIITQTFVKMWDQMSSKSATKWEPNENHIVKMWEKMRFEWKLHCQNVGKEWDSNENYIVKMWVQMRMQMRMEWILHHFVPIFSPWKTEPTRTKWCKKIHICQMPSIFVALPTIQPKTSQLNHLAKSEVEVWC